MLRHDPLFVRYILTEYFRNNFIVYFCHMWTGFKPWFESEKQYGAEKFELLLVASPVENFFNSKVAAV